MIPFLPKFNDLLLPEKKELFLHKRDNTNLDVIYHPTRSPRPSTSMTMDEKEEEKNGMYIFTIRKAGMDCKVFMPLSEVAVRRTAVTKIK